MLHNTAQNINLASLNFSSNNWGVLKIKMFTWIYLKYLSKIGITIDKLFLPTFKSI